VAKSRAADGNGIAATALRLGMSIGTITQGSSFLATLGFIAESRWDSKKHTLPKPDLRLGSREDKKFSLTLITKNLEKTSNLSCGFGVSAFW